MEYGVVSVGNHAGDGELPEIRFNESDPRSDIILGDETANDIVR